MGFKIEKGIPIPEGGRAKSGRMQALRQMEIGDSLFDPVENPSIGAQHARQSNWSNDAKVVQRKVVTRRVEGGIRVWRIS